MLLVQKPPSILPMPPNYATHHRRHPSAPVVVQPTNVPGMLSLSKPIVRQSPKSNQRHNQKQTPKSIVKPQVVRAPTLMGPHDNLPQSTTLAPTAPLTPSPRGRTQGKVNKDKTVTTNRDDSPSSTRVKHARQPSPPLPQPQTQDPSSQAEVPIINSSNHFDPFLDSSPTNMHITSKLVRRRQNQQAPVSPTPAPSKAIKVPRSNPAAFKFDGGADSVTPPTTPPATPKRNYLNEVVRTAPQLSHSAPVFDLSPSIKAARKREVKHRRAPSEGMFNMSSDDDSSSSDNDFFKLKLKANHVTPARSKPVAMPFATPLPAYAKVHPVFFGTSPSDSDCSLSEGIKAGYFASSQFQNSPSPDELPDPLLL